MDKRKKKLILIITIAFLIGLIVRMLGFRNGIMLCIVLTIGFFGIRREIQKMKNGTSEDEKPGEDE